MLKKNLFLVIAFVFVFGNGIWAQKLDAEQYHTHRGSLKNSFLKFEKEKTGRVVFLGGSITHNPGWRDSVSAYIQQLFPETEFDFINAGIPSMGTTPGAFRFNRDVLKNGKVDLLFEEAAVNDDTNRRTPKEITRAMEGIIRHARMANSNCDIVMMHFVDPGKMVDYNNGKTPDVIELHNQVAEHYNVPVINLAKEVTERINAGEFDWENDFINLHPSPFGQGIYANSIIAFLKTAYENVAESKGGMEEHKLPDPIDNANYSSGVLIEPSQRKAIKGWKLLDNWTPTEPAGTRANYTNVPMMVGTYPGKVIKLSFKGTAVGIAVAAGPNAGTIEYSIDDSEWMEQDLFTKWSKGLYLPWYYTLFSGLKNKRHILQIRVVEKKNPESLGNECILRYFYINEGNQEK